MLLDEIRLQSQRFSFRISNNEFNLVDLANHQLYAWTEHMISMEITPHSRPQFLGFTDIKNVILVVPHDIAARLLGDLPQPGFELLRILEQCGPCCRLSPHRSSR